MKLLKCTACDSQISKKAKTCPHCGHPVRRTTLFTWIVTVVALLVMYSCVTAPETPTTPHVTASKSVKSSSLEEKENTPFSNWSYSLTEDKMEGESIYFARTDSLNTATFGFPYSGAQHATLTLRTHPRYGKDLIFSIERGQFLCGYNNCTVLVKFDDKKATTFSASEPADHSTTTLFINNYSAFAGEMLKAKKVRIQAQFYQEGNHTFEFNVADFDVSLYRPKE